ncbi:Fc.00g111550.m01.CDS01 [Cosmosporella sp. VM-42]
MASKGIGPVAQAWYRWKALRLPWRKRFLMGFDLEGNTYWEFRLTSRGTGGNERWRRIVNYPRSTYLSSVKVSPLWHQWLRHTRQEPPSLDEQQGDVVRQARMKFLAAEADARWEAKPRVMDVPGGATGQRLPILESQDAAQEVAVEEVKPKETKPVEEDAGKSQDPWAKAKAQGPSENWQPSSWNPTPAKKR